MDILNKLYLSHIHNNEIALGIYLSRLYRDYIFKELAHLGILQDKSQALTAE